MDINNKNKKIRLNITRKRLIKKYNKNILFKKSIETIDKNIKKIIHLSQFFENKFRKSFFIESDKFLTVSHL